MTTKTKTKTKTKTRASASPKAVPRVANPSRRNETAKGKEKNAAPEAHPSAEWQRWIAWAALSAEHMPILWSLAEVSSAAKLAARRSGRGVKTARILDALTSAVFGEDRDAIEHLDKWAKKYLRSRHPGRDWFDSRHEFYVRASAFADAELRKRREERRSAVARGLPYYCLELKSIVHSIVVSLLPSVAQGLDSSAVTRDALAGLLNRDKAEEDGEAIVNAVLRASGKFTESEVRAAGNERPKT